MEYEREERPAGANEPSAADAAGAAAPPAKPKRRGCCGCLGCLGAGCGVLLVGCLLLGLGVWYVAATALDFQRNAFQPQPRPIAMPDPRSQVNQGRIVAFVTFLKGHEAHLRLGKTQTIELEPADLNLLLAGILVHEAEAGSADPRQGAAVSVEGDALRLTACLRDGQEPSRGYVNLDARFRLKVEDGRLTVAELKQFRLGDAELPGPLRALVPFAVRLVRSNREQLEQKLDPQQRADLAWLRRAVRRFEVKDGRIEVELDGAAVDWRRYDELTGNLDLEGLTDETGTGEPPATPAPF